MLAGRSNSWRGRQMATCVTRDPQKKARRCETFAQPKANVTEACLNRVRPKPIVAKNLRLAAAAEALRYPIEGGLSAGSSSQFGDLDSGEKR